MSSSGFENEVLIEESPETVRTFLLDLHNHTALHPLIESIVDLAPRPDQPKAKHYEIVDKVPVGPFRLKATYRATIEELSANEVLAQAWQKPKVYLKTTYRIDAAVPGTRLHESCEVSAPRLLRRFVTTQARQAHAESLQALKQHLEN